MKINEIKKILEEDNFDSEFLLLLESDSRSGVKKLLSSYYNKKEKDKYLVEEYEKRKIYEKKCYNLGFNYVCGIDEVGRGPLAGPVVAAGVILKKDSYYPGLTDSKKLSKLKREKLAEDIKKTAEAYFIAVLNSDEIEKYNIYNATKITMLKVIKNISKKPDFILIDAMPLDTENIKNISIIKGDEKSVSIAAASVIAKVYRDNLMLEYAKKYPYYDFENNMGYGTKKHLEAIYKYGICDIHRRDFEPIKSLLKKEDKNEKK